MTQMGGGANICGQHLEYCRAGHWEAHIARLCDLYKKRRDVTLSALNRFMPEGVTWTHPAGGFFIWLSLPDGLSAPLVKQTARERGVLLASGTGFFVNPATQPTRVSPSCARRHRRHPNPGATIGSLKAITRARRNLTMSFMPAFH
jgi:DNA-binding transcriptional MocR family regulator